MIPLWIPITLAAAFLQNARSAAQKSLSGRVGGGAATYARFCFALPFAAMFFAIAAGVEGGAAPVTAAHGVWLVVGALAQIVATALLIASFGRGPFTLGTAASKTEPVLAAAAGALLLSEVPPPLALVGIALGVAGVILAGLARSSRAGPTADGQPQWRASDRRAALVLGVVSGGFFALSAVGVRGASLALGDGSAALRAAQTLVATTLLQTVVMGAYLAVRDPAGLRALAGCVRPGLWIGFFGASASLGWFLAMTLEPAAHVRALAQVELLFTALTAILLFRERPGPWELLGVALVGAGAALLLSATV